MLTKHHVLGELVLVLMLGMPILPLVAAQHQISVKVLDSTNGKPIKRIYALLTWEQNGLWKGPSERTDSKGLAIFDLPNALPGRVGLSFSPDEFGSCSDVEFSTTQILETGVVSGCEDSKLHYNSPPHPGELVVFGKPVTLWERIRREMP